MWLLPFLTLFQSLASPVQVEVDGGVTVGQILYANLWTGGPIFGGFHARAPVNPLERGLVHPWVMGTAKVGGTHRFNITANLRTLRLQKQWFVEADEPAVYERNVLTSDGWPIEHAWRERLFLDEFSWRARLGKQEPWVVFRMGILPFGIAEGRFLAESWPGLSVTMDLDKLGAAPFRLDVQAAVTTTQAYQGAVALSHEPSKWEHLRVEVAFHHDPSLGVARLVEDDFDMATSVFGAATRPGLTSTGRKNLFYGNLALQYLDGGDLRVAHGDILEFLQLEGQGTLVYPTVSADLFLGTVRLQAGITGCLGWGTMSGNLLSPDAELVSTGATAGDTAVYDDPLWFRNLETERLHRNYRVAGISWDVQLMRSFGHLAPYVFFQGMTGDSDIVSAIRDNGTVHAFLASDQAPLRTRLFPSIVPLKGGGWSSPPGIGMFGLMTVGGGVTFMRSGLAGRVQVAIPMSMEPSCAPCESTQTRHHLYGGEIHGLIEGSALPNIRPGLDAGLFFPGAFFVDASSQSSDEVSDFPIGWQLFATVAIHFQKSER